MEIEAFQNIQRIMGRIESIQTMTQQSFTGPSFSQHINNALNNMTTSLPTTMLPPGTGLPQAGAFNPLNQNIYNSYVTGARTISVPGIIEDRSGDCGKASVAMAIKYMTGKHYSTSELTFNLKHELTSKTGQNWNSMDPSSDNFSSVINSLRSGKPVVLGTDLYKGGSNIWGHIITLTGYDPVTDTFTANNPLPGKCETGVQEIGGVKLTRQNLMQHLNHADGKWCFVQS